MKRPAPKVIPICGYGVAASLTRSPRVPNRDQLRAKRPTATVPNGTAAARYAVSERPTRRWGSSPSGSSAR